MTRYCGSAAYYRIAPQADLDPSGEGRVTFEELDPAECHMVAP
jgi:hypothetical protein